MELLQVVKAKEAGKALELLASGAADVTYERYEEGTWGAHTRESALHHALFNLRDEVYRQREAKSKEPLQWRQVVLELLEKGAKVNSKYESYDWRGCGSSQTAFELILSMALSNEDGALLDAALRHGGDPNTKSVSNTHSMRTDGSSVTYPIHTAASTLSYDCIKALLDAKADVNVRHTAVYHNERGYNSNTSATALHKAISAFARLPKTQSTSSNDYENEGEDAEQAWNKKHKEGLRVIALLLQAGAEIDAQRKELVQEHVEVNSPTDDPRDPAFIPSVRCVPRTETPLLQALRLGCADLVRLLVAHGADTSATYLYGEEAPRSALQMALDFDSRGGGEEKGGEMVAALRCRWEPQYSALYPEEVRARLFTTLCMAKRLAWPLPAELLHLILRWVASP
ncbi:hypothetical protein QOT17_006452 [Balamuthia mandrillaris]